MGMADGAQQRIIQFAAVQDHLFVMDRLDRALPLYEHASQLDADNGRALSAYLNTLRILRGPYAVYDVCRRRLQQAEDAEREGRLRDALRIYRQVAAGAPLDVGERDAARQAVERLDAAH